MGGDKNIGLKRYICFVTRILIITFLVFNIVFACGCIQQKTAQQWYDEGLNTAAHDNRFEDAIKCYDKAIEIDPCFDEAWYAKGVCLSNLQRFNESIECYDKAIELNPQNGLAYYQKSKALIGLQRYDDAEIAYNEAISIDPRLAG